MNNTRSQYVMQATNRLRQFESIVAPWLAGLVFAAVLPISSIAQDAVYPGPEWQEWATAEEAGFDLEKLSLAIPHVINNMQTTGLMVVAGGKVLGQFGDVEELSYIASCRKSVLAILCGAQVQNGKLRLDATLEELGIDDLQGLSPIEKSATVRQLMNCRSGVYHPASNSGDDSRFAPARGSKTPGEYFLYNNWDFNVVGVIFEQAAETDIYDALEQQLAVPLEMQDFDRSVQRKDDDLTASKHPAFPMWLSTRDMARVGYLMLRRGRWKDSQIAPPEWIDLITKPVSRCSEMNPPALREEGLGFGYMWWVWDDPAAKPGFRGAYTARGAFGQFITVLPELDLVVAHKTKIAYARSTEWPEYVQLLNLIVDARLEE